MTMCRMSPVCLSGSSALKSGPMEGASLYTGMTRSTIRVMVGTMILDPPWFVSCVVFCGGGEYTGSEVCGLIRELWRVRSLIVVCEWGILVFFAALNCVKSGLIWLVGARVLLGIAICVFLC